MKRLTLVSLIVSLIVATGCGRSQSKPVVASDPVKELKEAMTLFDSERIMAGVTPKTFDYSFDVRKTDSMVSPFIGTVEYFVKRGGGEFREVKYIASFAFQENKWVVKSLCFAIRNPSESQPNAQGCDDRADSPEVRDLLKIERKRWEDVLEIKYSK